MSFCSYICPRLSSTPLLFSFLCSEFWWLLPLDLPAHECSSQYYHTIFKFSITLSNSKLKLFKFSQNLGLVFVILVSEVWCFLWQLICTRSLVLTKTQKHFAGPHSRYRKYCNEFKSESLLSWSSHLLRELFFAFLPWLLMSSGTFLKSTLAPVHLKRWGRPSWSSKPVAGRRPTDF